MMCRQYRHKTTVHSSKKYDLTVDYLRKKRYYKRWNDVMAEMLSNIIENIPYQG